MKTKAVRIYGKKDLRLEEFDLPPLKDDEILAHVVSDSLCMSSYKAASQGPEHKRIPNDVAQNPTIIGHEFAGEILEVGKRWQDSFQPGQKFAIQPSLFYKGSYDAPGYSYRHIGGNATYVIVPSEVMECNCLLPYNGPGYYPASLAEPISCIAAALEANYHTVSGTYEHIMGIKEKGKMIILGGCGPMGLGAIDCVLHRDRRPARLVLTDIDQGRLDRAERLLPPSLATKQGVDLRYHTTAGSKEVAKELLAMTGGSGYDDVFVFAPVRAVVETADRILGRDGCLNFFAGPTDPKFSAEINFYNVHYAFTHIAGTSGGAAQTMVRALEMISAGRLNPAVMITHIGGLNAAIKATLNLPTIPGGKKLIYTNIDMDLTAIDDFEEKGKGEPLFQELARITNRNNGLWSVEAEDFLLRECK